REIGIKIPGRGVDRSAILDICTRIQFQKGTAWRRRILPTTEMHHDGETAAEVGQTSSRPGKLSGAIGVFNPLTGFWIKYEIGRNTAHPNGLVSSGGFIRRTVGRVAESANDTRWNAVGADEA